jgi:hypothetical protein
MSNRNTLWAVGLVALTTLAGVALSQPARIIRLPSAEEVFDLEGEWDALIEVYGQTAARGAYPNDARITITGRFCPITGQTTSPARVEGAKFKRNTPSQESGQPGRELFRGELESNNFAWVKVILDNGEALPCKGQILENGNKIVIELPNH